MTHAHRHDPLRTVELVGTAGRHRGPARLHKEEGFSTAELLGNAALGIAALVAIWAVLQVLGVDVVNFIRAAILGGTSGPAMGG